MFKKLTIEDQLRREKESNLIRLNNSILKDLENKEANISQGIKLSEREINEIIMGRQISDIEIDVLELQIGGI